MNIANKISIFRIILVPIIFILIVLVPLINEFNIKLGDKVGYSYNLPILWIIAVFLFIIASFSDFLDGYIARKYNMVTNTGKLLDAIADKILINAVLIALLYESIIPVWVVFIIITRDFCVDTLRLVLLSNQKIALAANKLGKFKTTVLMISIIILVFVNTYTINYNNIKIGMYSWINQVVLIPLYIGTLLSLASGINYFILNVKYIIPKKNKN